MKDFLISIVWRFANFIELSDTPTDSIKYFFVIGSILIPIGFIAINIIFIIVNLLGVVFNTTPGDILWLWGVIKYSFIYFVLFCNIAVVFGKVSK